MLSSVSASSSRDSSTRSLVTGPLDLRETSLVGPSAISKVGRYNYKVVTKIGFKGTGAIPSLIVLDTGANPNLLHEDTLPGFRIAPLTSTRESLGLGDASGHASKVKGTTALTLILGYYTSGVPFPLVERQSTPSILSCA